jgi:hypothetical protein
MITVIVGFAVILWGFSILLLVREIHRAPTVPITAIWEAGAEVDQDLYLFQPQATTSDCGCGEVTTKNGDLLFIPCLTHQLGHQ